MVILGVLSLLIYNSTNSKTDSDLGNEAYITASGIGQSMIDQILNKSFDQKSISKTLTLPDSLTAVASLGPDSGESTVGLFNDVDDYKNFIKIDTLSVLGIFKTKVDVNYVQKFNPDVKSNVKTFTKRIDVFVTNAFLPDTLKLKYAIAY